MDRNEKFKSVTRWIVFYKCFQLFNTHTSDFYVHRFRHINQGAATHNLKDKKT